MHHKHRVGTRNTAIRRTPGLARMPLTAAIYVAFGSMAFAGAAIAQDADDATPSLETITVTSQKRTENAQDVPISLNVIGAQ